MSKLTRLSLALLVIGASIVYLTGCGGVSQPPPAGQSQVMVYPAGVQTLLPLELTWPDTPRWMDIADQSYSTEFGFQYADQVTVDYVDSASTLTGTLAATGLKPWFAYQMKLVGKKGVLGHTEAANLGDQQAWSSYQLGSVGRWWCEECGWNLNDNEVQRHVKQGHTVVGYLLFDWFVTDKFGNATHDFALDSSFHVLWKASQRARTANDSAPRSYHLVRGECGYAYPSAAVDLVDDVTVYAEWESTRPKPGDVQLAAGDYVVSFNLTEETFHNVPPDLATTFPWGYTNYEYGGFWAKVLGGDLAFTVSGGGGNGEEPTGTGAIEGTVTYGDGSVARKAYVTLTDAVSVEVASTQTRGNGVYRFRDVPAGTYTVTAKQGDLSATTDDVQVTAGQTTTVDLVLVSQ
ncbi:MAG: carboxypeptidase-like regulatory domain-containing protein [Armatimonadota bacterium]|nr:carboxypeptidase-like regulatory domain-containing protein [Armatimonadota bacterium]